MNLAFSPADFAAFCAAHRPAYQRDYYAMYSSWFDAVTTEPNLMVLPADDHMVHRGDGIFETFKVLDGAAYNLPAHWDRLEDGCRAIGLPLPWSRARLEEILAHVLRAAAPHRDALIRLFVSRGPGGHSVSPAECPVPLLTVIAVRLSPPFMDLHPGGASVALTDVPVKPDFFARVKSFNYLPNALMRADALRQHVDFTLALDPDGNAAELPTETFGILTPSRALRIPAPVHVLRGTTAHRVLDLAREHLLPAGVLSAVEEAPITPADLDAAPEMYVFGTTPDVTAVTTFCGRPVGTGAPGPVWRALRDLLLRDLRNSASLTPLV